VTAEHVLYIPGVLLIGMTLGYLFGAKAARAEMARAKKRLKE
jgi:proteasome assembly chaperone (PAC2) family protein